VATASLLLFVNADDLALKLLQEAKLDREFHDYTLPYLHSKIMYFFGEPVDRYKLLLDQMLRTSNDTLVLTEKVKSRCPSRICDSETEAKYSALRKRAERSAIIAMNNIAYGIAQDIAARVETVEPLQPLAQEYAEKLADIVKKGEITDETERDNLNDTIAFVSLVDEGRKSIRDMTKIKGAIAAFKLIIVHQEDLLKARPLVQKLERLTLNTARAHLSSAEELLE
jgi:hypothetical protein